MSADLPPDEFRAYKPGDRVHHMDCNPERDTPGVVVAPTRVDFNEGREVAGANVDLTGLVFVRWHSAYHSWEHPEDLIHAEVQL